MKTRAVFDCMVFVQALARPNGPAARCLALAGSAFELVVSDAVLAEVTDVVGRPKLRQAFIRATDADIERFFNQLASVVTSIDQVPAVVTLARDPKDTIYLDLAVAAGAGFVVTRDNDLLDLMTGSDPDAEAFRTAYPAIRILDPAAFLRALAPPPAPADPDEAS